MTPAVSHRPRPPDTGTRPSIYARMAMVAEACGALNLAAGIPDDGPPPALVAAATRAMMEGHNQYPPSEGVGPLRHEISRVAAHSQGVEYAAATEVTVTAGCSEGVVATLMALLAPGDEVIALEPFYDYYPEWVRMAGAHLVGVPMWSGPDGFRVDPDAVAAAVTPRTRALLLNSPHNPTGACLTAELGGLADLACRQNLLVVVDEVYEHFVYDQPHCSIAALPGMRDRTVVVSSISKSFSATGWRVGWVLAPEPLSAPIRFAHRHIGFCAPTPLQVAAAHMLCEAEGSTFYEDLRRSHRSRRDRLHVALVEAGLRAVVPEGGLFLLAPSPWPSAEDFCVALAEHVGVVPLPLDSFYADHRSERAYVRFTFSRRDDVLDEAVRRLRSRAMPVHG